MRLTLNLLSSACRAVCRHLYRLLVTSAAGDPFNLIVLPWTKAVLGFRFWSSIRTSRVLEPRPADAVSHGDETISAESI